MPANGETITIETPPVILANMSRLLLKRTLEKGFGEYQLRLIINLWASKRLIIEMYKLHSLMVVCHPFYAMFLGTMRMLEFHWLMYFTCV